MERFSLDGGRGWLTVREENGRARIEAELPDDRRGLYKGWLLGAQFEALFRDGLYFELARRGNAMAARLQAGLKALDWQLWVDSPTNQIFLVVDQVRRSALQAICAFEDWRPARESGHTVIRLVTCFATTPEDVDGFLTAAARL